MSTARASVTVSSDTLHQLVRLRALFGASSLDDTIQIMVRDRQVRAIRGLFASGRDRIRGGFRESDRLGTHD